MSDNIEQEVTVREGTIFTLKKSYDGFEELKGLFEKVSDLFDNNKTIEALQEIGDNVIPLTNALFGFMGSLLESFDVVIGKELSEDIFNKLKSMNDLRDELVSLTVSNNFVELGEVLRFDYNDLIVDLESTIPKLIKAFEESDAKELDQL